MTTDENEARWKELRALWQEWRQPPSEVIAHLPRKARRADGGEYTIKLEYMGHAEVTEALLAADPLWSWEPVAWTEDGEPRITVRGDTARMWIRLTVHGMTRLGVGTCPAGKSDVEKELVGDAIRNAAMRFGVAVRLWSKAEGMERAAEADDSPAEPPRVFHCPECSYEAPAADMRVHLGTSHGWVADEATGRMVPNPLAQVHQDREAMTDQQ